MEIKFNKNPEIHDFHVQLEKLQLNYDDFRQKTASQLCLNQLQPLFPDSKLWLTHSGTAALEIIAHLLLKTGKKEVIVPSFCFVSTALAFQNKGFELKFAEADQATLSGAISDIYSLINENTAAVVWIHYAGAVAPGFEQLLDYCNSKGVLLIEDAALGFARTHANKSLGNFGSAAIFSFDITKPFSAIQGGLLVLNKPDWVPFADQYYHIGTNRTDFESGLVSSYQWVSEGSKCQMNELNAVFLLNDLRNSSSKMAKLKALSRYYFEKLSELQNNDTFTIPSVFKDPQNHHVFGLIFQSQELSIHVQNAFRNAQIEVFSHYQALHNTPFAREKGLYRELPVAQLLSTQYLRLPLHEELSFAQIDELICVLTESLISFKR